MSQAAKLNHIMQKTLKKMVGALKRIMRPFKRLLYIKHLLIRIEQKMFYDQKRKWDRIAFSFLNSCRLIVDVGCGEGRFMYI